MTCAECHYVRQSADGLQCRRHAPAALAESVTVQPMGHHHPQAAWPIVAAVDWCGEFKARVHGLSRAGLAVQQSRPAPVPQF